MYRECTERDHLKGMLLVFILVCFGEEFTQRHLAAQDQSPPQIYTDPTLFHGTLYVGSIEHLSDQQRLLLESELETERGQLVLIGTSADLHPSDLLKFLMDRAWKSVQSEKLELNGLGKGSCVYVSESGVKLFAKDSVARLHNMLNECLERGGMVCIDGRKGAIENGPRPLFSTKGLIPDVQFSMASAEEEATAKESEDVIHVELTSNSWLRVRGRELINLSEEREIQLVFPATEYYLEPLKRRLVAKKACDLVAARRARLERLQAPFPAETIYLPGVNKGSLVIVGGGGATSDIWEKFVKLAGGRDAKIVVLPTAVAEPPAAPSEMRMLERLGVQDVHVLPEIDRQAVSHPEYLARLKSATGVWFGGGRQWRFVDAYWGTPAWQAIIDVVGRGGVIGGSSAGATIQGDLLVRGSPLGNHIMIEDGYRRGLGLLSGVAIDQHFSQRNRFDDLMSVCQRFPSILGVGIDESTALVVESPGNCTVMGKGSVWVIRPRSPHSSSELTRSRFVERPTGSQFTFEEMRHAQ